MIYDNEGVLLLSTSNFNSIFGEVTVDKHKTRKVNILEEYGHRVYIDNHNYLEC